MTDKSRYKIFSFFFFLSFLGSFIFLAIEGGASQMHQRTLASTNRQMKSPVKSNEYNLTKMSKSLMQETYEAQQRTVENIWEITVSLNILYRENWTRYVNLSIFYLLCVHSHFHSCGTFLYILSSFI